MGAAAVAEWQRLLQLITAAKRLGHGDGLRCENVPSRRDQEGPRTDERHHPLRAPTPSFLEPFHQAACLAVPIHDPFGEIVGVLEGEGSSAAVTRQITEWLSEQPWSDGNVGIYGCSNTGDAAMHAATVRPPALKAVFAGCFSWHKYDPFRRGGIYAQWGTGPTRAPRR